MNRGAAQEDRGVRLVGHPGRLTVDQIDDEADESGPLVGNAVDADPPGLDETGGGLHSPCDEPAVAGLQPRPVVADEAGEPPGSLGGGDEVAAEERLPGSRRSPDEDRILPDEDAAGVQGFLIRHGVSHGVSHEVGHEVGHGARREPAGPAGGR